jgi:AbrB family looped-hinge helix DNA binding protein
MRAKVDSGGRVLIPKQIREALGLSTGTEVEISQYSSGLNIAPVGATSRLVTKDGRLVLRSDTVVTDEMIRTLRNPLPQW